jgi:CheY-like chemotaxis protein
VILNLAINARDAMPDGGMLTIATVGVGLDVLEGAALGLLPGHYVRITVSDNGLGMDAETLERCLEPFFTTKDRSKGTGLGLAAVQGIVTDGGGQIQVDSQAAVGTTFTLHLPVAVGELIAQIPLPPRPDIRGSETVLVVDDEADIRQLIRKVLLHDGYLVLDAGGGLEAVRVAERWEGPIELLITDVVMPGMRGPEVATAIRAIRPSIEVLFMSGYTHGTTLPAGLSTDPLALLAKPFKPSELADRVRGILDQHYDRARARNGSPRPAPS